MVEPSILAMVGRPHLAMVISISSRRIFKTRTTPFSPSTASPQNRRPADEHRLGAQCNRFDHIGAAPDATVEINFELALGRRNGFGEHFDRRQSVIEMPAAVIGNDHAVGADFDAELDVFAGHDALGDNREIRSPL